MFGAYQHTRSPGAGRAATVDLVFGNVRDATWLTDDHFRARAGHLAVRDRLPVRRAGFSSAAGPGAARPRSPSAARGSGSIAWLPRFLSEDRMRDVRKLVILDWLLTGTGDRWRKNADHLSEVDRAQARAILESQRTALREGLRRAIQEAYGAARSTPGTLAEDTSHDRVLISLDPGSSRPPRWARTWARRSGTWSTRRSAPPTRRIPRFEPGDTEVTVRDLLAVYSHVERAVADPEGRVRLEGDIAAVRRVANALGVGQAAETHFLFGDDRFTPWAAEFERAAARDGIRPEDTVTVGQLRKWIDAMTPAVRAAGRGRRPGHPRLGGAADRGRGTSRAAPVPPPRPGARARRWSCGPSRCPPPPTGRRRPAARRPCSACT